MQYNIRYTDEAPERVDLICPFHTPENKMPESIIGQMLAGLIQGPFKTKKFKFHHTDPATGQRKVMEMGG